MVDPVTILEIINGSLGLALKSATVVNQLYDLSGKFKNVELSIRSLSNECEAIRDAWDQIGVWSQNCTVGSEQFLTRLARSIETGGMVISALGEDVLSLQTQHSSTAWPSYEDSLEREYFSLPSRSDPRPNIGYESLITGHSTVSFTQNP